MLGRQDFPDSRVLRQRFCSLIAGAAWSATDQTVGKLFHGLIPALASKYVAGVIRAGVIFCTATTTANVAVTSADPRSSAVIRRLIIVRRDAIEVYEQVHRIFGNDHETAILYDRRAESSRDGADETRGQRERRHHHEAEIVKRRGFYSIRARPAHR